MKESAMGVGDLGDRSDRLDDAGLVIGQHDRDESGPVIGGEAFGKSRDVDRA
jgi:hypothetical protein